MACKRRHFRNWGMVLAVVTALAMGCSKNPAHEQSKETGGGSKIPRETGLPGNAQEYVRSEQVSDLGQLEIYSITPEAFERRRAVLENTTLRALELSGEFNTEVFALEGTETRGVVITKPRVYLRNTGSSGRLKFRDLGEGNILVDLSVAIVDGLQVELISGSGTHVVPDDYRVREPERFLRELESSIGVKPSFLSTVRCPERLRLNSPEFGSLPVHLNTKLKVCPMNTFFPASLALAGKELELLLFALATGAPVELDAELNLKPTLTVEFIKLRIDRLRLLERLHQVIGEARRNVPQAELNRAFDRVVEEMQKVFGIAYAPEEFASIKARLLAENFKQRSLSECQNSLGFEEPCYSVEPNLAKNAEPFFISLRREESFGRGLRLQTKSRISDEYSERQEFTLRAAPGDPLTPPEVGEASSLFRTMQEGEVAEFRIRNLRLGSVELSEPKISRSSHLVCMDPFSTCTQGDWHCDEPAPAPYNCKRVEAAWADIPSMCQMECPTSYGSYFHIWKTEPGHSCVDCWPGSCPQAKSLRPNRYCRPEYFGKSWIKVRERTRVATAWNEVCDEKPACEFAPKPGRVPTLPVRIGDANFPKSHFWSWRCTQVLQNQCDLGAVEDHWERVTTWSIPAVNMRLEEHGWNADFWPRLLSGLKMKFSYQSESGLQSYTCPLVDLETRFSGDDRLVVFFRNTEKCKPFNEQNRKPGYGPSISLVSQVAFPSEFQCGSMTETWEGKRRYFCRLPNGMEEAFETTAAEDDSRLQQGLRLGIFKPFYPRVEIQGALRMVGANFQSKGEIR